MAKDEPKPPPAIIRCVDCKWWDPAEIDPDLGIQMGKCRITSPLAEPGMFYSYYGWNPLDNLPRLVRGYWPRTRTEDYCKLAESK